MDYSPQKDGAYNRSANPGLSTGQPTFAEEIDLRDLFQKLWRRKGLIFGTVMFMTVLTIIILFQLTPLYKAQTSVLIEPRDSNVVNLEAVLSGLGGDAETIQSEIEVIKSRALISKLVDKLKLDQNPEFNTRLKPKGLMATYLNPREYIPEEWMDVLRGGRGKIVLSEDDLQAQQRVGVINAILGKKLAVSIKGRSRVISIEFTSETPKLAARAANTLANFYINAQLEAKFEATQHATQWLSDRVATLRETVKSSENAVEAFRKKSGLLSGQTGTLTSQQVSELNTQMILAQSSRAEADARLRQVRDLVNSAGGGETASQVLDSPLIQRLREQEAEVERKAADLSEEYGARHPKMINVLSEAQDIKKKIRQEVTKIIKGLENEVGVAKARENSLRKSLETLKGRLSKSNRAEVQLRSLEREATANRMLFENFLGRYKETSEQENRGIQRADARVISVADIPSRAAFPKKSLILTLAIIGSTFLGTLFAFAIEQLDKGFRSSEQIEQMIGVRALGLVPALGKLTLVNTTPEKYILDHPTSAFTEAIRSLNTALQISGADGSIKKIMLTSAVPGEGKSTISICLMRLLAKAGHSVVLVDLDLRKPSIHNKLQIKSEPGVAELISGKYKFTDVVIMDQLTSGHIIPAGAPSNNPPDLLGNDIMDQLLKGLEKRYDYVIIDTPPVLAVSDAKILSQKVDATIFVAHWAETKREVVIQGIKEIQSSRGYLAGVVLSQVHVEKHSKYGYGDSGAYYGKIKKYYSS
jgi:succinoglycan biosynthesis transport protein ExoP